MKSDNNGYIKLFRNFLKWEWYCDTPTKILFLHILLKANHKPQKWQGQVIETGQLISSLKHLATETGLTVMQVRTSINKLNLTQEITSKSTSRNTLITINNWNEYQANNTNSNKQITNEQQTDNKQITTNKNEKNEKNEKNILFISEKQKKVDPFTNSLNSYFCEQYKEVFSSKQKVFLSHGNRTRLLELAAEYPDIRELIPKALEKLKAIDFKDIDFTPSASWLLRGDNFERVMNGEFDKKTSKEEIPLWMKRLREKDNGCT